MFIHKEVSFVPWLLGWSHIAQKTVKDGTVLINDLPTVRALLLLQWLVKGKGLPLQDWTGPEQHMKVVRFSVLCSSHLYPPGNIPGTHFC